MIRIETPNGYALVKPENEQAYLDKLVKAKPRKFSSKAYHGDYVFADSATPPCLVGCSANTTKWLDSREAMAALITGAKEENTKMYVDAWCLLNGLKLCT